MLTIIPACLLVLVYASRLGLLGSKELWFNIFVVFSLTYFSISETVLLSSDQVFFRLDEAFFYNEALAGFKEIIDGHDRYLLFILYNHLALESALYSPYVLKFHLVPFALLIGLLIYDATKNSKSLLIYPLFFSYIVVLSTLNMRDVLIISATLYASIKLSRSIGVSSFFWMFFPAVFFLFIRPEASVFWLLASMWYILFVYLKRKTFIVYVVPAVAIILLFTMSFESSLLKLSSYFFSAERIEYYVHDRSSELDVIPFLSENAVAMIRQLVTPLPHSKIIKILDGDPGPNLYVYEISRAIMMICVYGLVLMSFFRFRVIKNNFENNDCVKIIFAIALFYSLGYSIFSDGGGDSRNKLYPFLFLYLVYFIRDHKAFRRGEVC